MAPQPVENSARRISETLDQLSAILGTREANDGLYLTWELYRPVLEAATTMQERRQILNRLVEDVYALLVPIFAEADQASQAYIEELNLFYDLEIEPLAMVSEQTLMKSTRDFVQAYVTNIEAQLALGYTDQVFGDGNRIGFWTPSGLQRQFDYLLIALPSSYFQRTYASKATIRDEYAKEWLSLIDNRTTQTCIQTDGQIVRLDKKFRIRGTPRFADWLDWPPAHFYCRSVVGLVPLEIKMPSN